MLKKIRVLTYEYVIRKLLDTGCLVLHATFLLFGIPYEKKDPFQITLTHSKAAASVIVLLKCGMFQQ